VIPQIAITGLVLREIVKLSISPMDKAMCDLFVGAFFFPMRSYKYVKVQGYHKTKLLVIKNIHFFQNNVNIPHNSNKLHLADSVSINFESQKRDTKNDMITQHHSGDPILCPVIIWCKVVKHLLSYSSTTQDTTVNMFQLPKKKHITFQAKSC